MWDVVLNVDVGQSRRLTQRGCTRGLHSLSPSSKTSLTLSRLSSDTLPMSTGAFIVMSLILNTDSVGQEGLTPLALACKEGNTDIVYQLVAAGAYVNLQVLSLKVASDDDLHFRTEAGTATSSWLVKAATDRLWKRFSKSLFMMTAQNRTMVTIKSPDMQMLIRRAERGRLACTGQWRRTTPLW